MAKEIKTYCIYLHIKLTNGEPFYVGKGSKSRVINKSNRSKWWKRTVDKYGYDVILIEENLTEEEAFEKEKYWIDRIGRRDLDKGPLVNMTDGGEGTSGRKWIVSEETKKKMSLSKIGIKHSDEHNQNISKSNRGNNCGKRNIILDTSNGVFYYSLTEAADAFSIPIPRLSRYLLGTRTNKTTLIYT
jgi:hypothetical protein